LAVTLVMALAAGCGSGPRTGSRLPAFEAVDEAGRPVTPQALDGAVAVYYFWATWCAPCVVSSPELQMIHDRYEDDEDVRVIGVHYDHRGTPRDYMRQHGYTFELIPDGRAMVSALGVKKIPQVIVVSPAGEVVLSQVGFAKGDGEEIVGVIEGLRGNER
jgi:thiol-disulfide isomerase/thioredoxin